MADQQFCLRWNNHQSTLISVFDSLQERGCMVDCTLAAEGQSLQAHKVVLSACSPYLEDLLSKHYDKHPILLLKDVKYEELRAMLDYMYRGEVNVAQDKLNSFLKAAESLQIKGLSDGGTDPPDSGGTSGVKRTSKGAPISVRSNQLSVRSTNLNEESLRDGSVSPSLRKRRRRRGSEGSDHDSSCNVLDGKQSSAAAPVSGPSIINQDLLPTVPTSGNADANLLLSSIMESAETENVTDSGVSSATNVVPLNSQDNIVIGDKDSDVLVEPKTEYLDDDAQDLHMEDDGMFGAGPSHARASGHLVGGGVEDFMTGQDSGASAQGLDVKILDQKKMDEESLADMPLAARLAASIQKKVIKDDGPIITSIGFVKDEVHADTPIKVEPKDEDDVLDNGLPLPRPEDNDDYAHDDAFGGPMDMDQADQMEANDDLMLLEDSHDGQPEGEDQVRRSKRQFFCKECPARFNRPNHLKKHALVHKANKPFQCPDCTASFPSESRLTQHAVVHTGDAFRCDKCGETFTTATLLRDHLQTHSWPCPHCGTVFGTLHGLKIHARSHNIILNTYMCSECPESFNSKDELKVHKRLKHPTAPQPPPPPPVEESPDMHTECECEYCGQKFSSSFLLLAHAKDHIDKEFACLYCPAQFETRKDRSMHVIRRHPRHVKCTQCDLVFATSTEMETHLTTHSKDDEQLRCEFCPKVFNTNYHLLQHMQSHEVKHECSICQATFLNISQLELHHKTHTEGAYRCEDCGQRFQFKPQLVTHMREHDNQKPFGCEECSIRFKSEAQLLKHQRSHNRATSAAINCSECGAPFMNSSQLLEHVRTHHVKKAKATYWCEDCAESFPTKTLIEQHMRSHPNKELFQCEHCTLNFGTEYGLLQHMRTHSDERPYLCGYCEASFTLKEHMIRHMKAHKKK